MKTSDEYSGSDESGSSGRQGLLPTQSGHLGSRKQPVMYGPSALREEALGRLLMRKFG
jgi:hypothetical protein